MFDKDISRINTLDTLDICSSKEQALKYLDNNIKNLTSYLCDDNEKLEKVVDDIIYKIHSEFTNCNCLTSYQNEYNILGNKIIFNVKIVEINLNTL